MDYSEVLLGLRQVIACGKISQQDLNLITQYPEVKTTLRDAFGSLNAEHINRMLNEADISITENDAGHPQLEIIVHRRGFPHVLKMTLLPSQLQPSHEPELTQSSPIHIPRAELNSVPDRCEPESRYDIGSGSPLPPFDPTVEREAPAHSTDFSDPLSRQIASGAVEVSREDVSIEEVIAKIEALEQEQQD